MSLFVRMPRRENMTLQTILTASPKRRKSADSAEERAAPAMTGMRLAAMPHETCSDLRRKVLRPQNPKTPRVLLI